MFDSEKYRDRTVYCAHNTWNYVNGKPMKAEALISDNRRKTRISIIAFPRINRRKEHNALAIMRLGNAVIFSFEDRGWRL